MAYHEAFWVVIGTAAPVITLAATVGYHQLSSQPAPKHVTWFDTSRAAIGYLALGGCVLLQVAALTDALNSLGDARDLGSLQVAKNLVVCGLGLLFLGVIPNMTLWSSRRPKQRKPGRRDSDSDEQPEREHGETGQPERDLG